MALVSLDHHVPVRPAGDVAPARPPLTLAMVDEIVAIGDPGLRNLWITESYADLAARLLDVLETDQSWCSFATWASNTAGCSIRGEELPHVVETLLPEVNSHLSNIVDAANEHSSHLRRFGLTAVLERTGVESLVETAIAQVSDHIAHGNTLVYAELAPIFVRFAEWFDATGGNDGSEVGEVLHRLGVPEEQDDPLVHLAFRSYTLAARSADGRARAQLVLTANVAAVLHEQQRLQQDIADALDAGLLDVEGELARRCHRWLPDSVTRWIARRTHDRIAHHVEHLWEHLATRLMMTLVVPGETLHLGSDVPPLPNGADYPASLRAIDHPELVRLLTEWDPTGGTTAGSAAGDWADLHERMGYIVNLFRSRQQSLRLTASPFDNAEFAMMQDGLAMADGTHW